MSISSDQSQFIDSYEGVKEKYLKSLKYDDLKKCPDFWGGYSFTPYYFEFWEGHMNRGLIKGMFMIKLMMVGSIYFLQP